MALDKAEWHYGGNLLAELPDENRVTHIGLFLAWIIDNQLEGEVHHEDAGAEQTLAAVRQRQMNGRDFLLSQCDEKFWAVDLNAEGLAFAPRLLCGRARGLWSLFGVALVIGQRITAR